MSGMKSLSYTVGHIVPLASPVSRISLGELGTHCALDNFMNNAKMISPYFFVMTQLLESTPSCLEQMPDLHVLFSDLQHSVQDVLDYTE